MAPSLQPPERGGRERPGDSNLRPEDILSLEDDRVVFLDQRRLPDE